MVASLATVLPPPALLLRGGSTALTTAAAFATTSSTSTTSPNLSAVANMAVAMALHYLGYSLARPATVALFTSATTGYQGRAAAFPAAMACVSPMSLLLLVWYHGVLDRKGPRGALEQSTLLCAGVVALCALGMSWNVPISVLGRSIGLAKLLSGPLFIFRESYVQLLTSQYWSFMASALTPDQSAVWFGPVAGLTSIASASAGLLLTPMVNALGLPGVLLGTSSMLVCSLVFARRAYGLAQQHGFEPQAKKKQMHSKDDPKVGLIAKTTKLFRRVPVLGALFGEILASQGLATVLNICFVACLSSAIPDDGKRAGYVAIFFSVVNLCTMVLQFGILPRLLTVLEPKTLWKIVPLLSCIVTTFQALQIHPSLLLASLSLGCMKVSEYSARRMLDEMIFVPLDFEARFVGKEIIGVFGYRFGKSLMSLGLSVLTATTDGMRSTSILSAAVAYTWWATAWRLSGHVPTRKEAQAAHKKNKK